jgi:hypothetical protein
MSNNVFAWWCVLCAIATANIVGWIVSAKVLKRRAGSLSPEDYSARRAQLVLAAIYVAGCAYRSFFPVFDVPRQVLFDTWLSSVMIGRSVATVAELAFAAQWALMMRETARATGSDFAHFVSRAIMPLLILAEGFSWYSVLSTSNLGHTIEECLWGLSAALVVACMVAIRPRCVPVRRWVVLAWCVAGFAYVGYMFFVDVPMYWSRWVAEGMAGQDYLSIGQGIVDASTRRVVTGAWEDWRGEVLWMTSYFSIGVWVSLSLIHAPAPERSEASGKRRRVFVAAPWSMRTPQA